MRRTEELRSQSETKWEKLAQAGAAFAVALPLYVAWIHGVLDFERNSALTAALIGTLVIYVFSRPRVAAWIPVVALASAYSALYFWRHAGFRDFSRTTPIICGAMLGLAAVTVLAFQAIVCEPIHRSAKRSALMAAAFVPYLTVAMAFALSVTPRLHPRTYDVYLYAFDASLGLPVSAVAARLLTWAPPLAIVSALMYEMLPLAISITIAVQRSRPRWFAVDLVKLLLVSGVIGFLLYNCFPAAGPKYAFGPEFPSGLPRFDAMVVEPAPVPGAPRNAMPSLSLACAVLLWWNARRLPVLGKAFLIFWAALIVLANLGFGEHYLVDLIVALPFAVSMQALALSETPMRSYLRWAPLSGGAALTGAWLGALRLNGSVFQTGLWLPWASVLGTVLLCALWKIMLDRASDCVAPQALNVTEFPLQRSRRVAFTGISKR